MSGDGPMVVPDAVPLMAIGPITLLGAAANSAPIQRLFFALDSRVCRRPNNQSTLLPFVAVPPTSLIF